MSTDVNYTHGNNNSTDNKNYEINSTNPGSSTSNLTHSLIPQTFIYTKPNIHQHSKCFSANYNGPPVIIIESTESSSGTGIWHPLKCAKFFCNNFFGINNIKPNGHKKIKITFDSTFLANTCLESPILQENKLSAYIPSTLIFSHGIIKLDTAFPVEDFWDGIKSEIEIVAFKRISTNKDGNITPTRIVELKFLSSKIPKYISIYNMLFEVSPSIRSPLQCKNCLRFGHTSKFCRSSPTCSHCGVSKHSIESCPTAQATEPCCLYCQLPHLATDRNCREWKSQRDLKKIMATENISFRDAVTFKKQNLVTPAFSYSNIVSNQPSTPLTKTTIVPRVINSVPTSPPHAHSINSQCPTKKQKFRSPSPNKNHFNLPKQTSSSVPNGEFLKYVINNRSDAVTNIQNNDFSWVNTLSQRLSESLLNSPDLSTQSATSLKNLIESSLLSLLAIPNISITSHHLNQTSI